MTEMSDVKMVATATIHGCSHGLELPSAKRAHGSNSPIIAFSDRFKRGISGPAHVPKNYACFLFSFLIAFLAFKYGHRLHEVMSDQTEPAHTPSPTERSFTITESQSSRGWKGPLWVI